MVPIRKQQVLKVMDMRVYRLWGQNIHREAFKGARTKGKWIVVFSKGEVSVREWGRWRPVIGVYEKNNTSDFNGRILAIGTGVFLLLVTPNGRKKVNVGATVKDVLFIRDYLYIATKKGLRILDTKSGEIWYPSSFLGHQYKELDSKGIRRIGHGPVFITEEGDVFSDAIQITKIDAIDGILYKGKCMVLTKGKKAILYGKGEKIIIPQAVGISHSALIKERNIDQEFANEKKRDTELKGSNAKRMQGNFYVAVFGKNTSRYSSINLVRAQGIPLTFYTDGQNHMFVYPSRIVVFGKNIYEEQLSTIHSTAHYKGRIYYLSNDIYQFDPDSSSSKKVGRLEKTNIFDFLKENKYSNIALEIPVTHLLEYDNILLDLEDILISFHNGSFVHHAWIISSDIQKIASCFKEKKRVDFLCHILPALASHSPEHAIRYTSLAPKNLQNSLLDKIAVFLPLDYFLKIIQFNPPPSHPYVLFLDLLAFHEVASLLVRKIKTGLSHYYISFLWKKINTPVTSSLFISTPSLSISYKNPLYKPDKIVIFSKNRKIPQPLLTFSLSYNIPIIQMRSYDRNEIIKILNLISKHS